MFMKSHYDMAIAILACPAPSNNRPVIIMIPQGPAEMVWADQR